MTSTPFTCLKGFSAIALLATLGACGSGSSPEASDNGNNDSPPVVNTVDSVVDGTIVVTERNGKTVLDGWFTQRDNSAAALPSLVEQQNLDQCGNSYRSSVPEFNDQPLITTGTAVSISSRSGTYATLQTHSLDGTVVYASNERWISTEFPGDATLTFSDGGRFSEVGNVDMPPLPTLVWLEPYSGFMDSAAQVLQWEPGNSTDTVVRLHISGHVGGENNIPTVVNVYCEVMDDGEFVLPEHSQLALADVDSALVVYPVRERVQRVSSDSASLTVVQQGYAAAVKP